MKPRFHNVRAFLDINAALEVRDMTPFCTGCGFLHPVTVNKREGTAC
ncbi:hypothetical protein RUM8411_00724 [Ruegeria meonggei]|uniref:Uncharacterized protein n=1 Tax=Ruegeria meonggei TaxID=1446476 RepID=A0A1X6YIB0_9RHOB|nr:hypothetical protein RUM8411_00724 [Ruegeria meonggei]